MARAEQRSRTPKKQASDDDRRRARAARMRRRRARRLLVLVLVVVGVLAYAGPVRSWRNASAEVEAGRAEVIRLRHEGAQLQRQINALKRPATVEAAARREGWIMPGETPYALRP